MVHTVLAIAAPTLGLVGVSSGFVVSYIGVTTAPASGNVVVASDGTWTYTPANGFTGTVSFVYELGDYYGNLDNGTVSITVGGPALAATGLSPLPALGVAGTLLVLGLVVLVSRRRRSTRS